MRMVKGNLCKTAIPVCQDIVGLSFYSTILAYGIIKFYNSLDDEALKGHKSKLSRGRKRPCVPFLIAAIVVHHHHYCYPYPPQFHFLLPTSPILHPHVPPRLIINHSLHLRHSNWLPNHHPPLLLNVVVSSSHSQDVANQYHRPMNSWIHDVPWHVDVLMLGSLMEHLYLMLHVVVPLAYYLLLRVMVTVVVVRYILRCCCDIAAVVHYTPADVDAAADLDHCKTQLLAVVDNHTVLDFHWHNIDLQDLHNFDSFHRFRRHYIFLDHWYCNIAVVGIGAYLATAVNDADGHKYLLVHYSY